LYGPWRTGHGKSIGAGVTIPFEFIFHAYYVGASLRWQLFDGIATQLNTGDGETFYLKNVVIDKLSTNASVRQPVTANVPKLINGNTALGTNGIAEFYEADEFAALVENQSLGTYYMRFKDLEGPATHNVFFGLGGTTANDIVQFQLFTDNSLYLSVNVNGTWNFSVFPTKFTRSTDSTLIIKSNGSSYTAIQNGVDLGTPTNNTGQWHDATLTSLQIATIGKTPHTAAYYNNEYTCIMYVKKITSASDDLSMISWMEALKV